MEQKPIELILLRRLADRLGLPVWLVDPEGRVLYWNGPAERLLGPHVDDEDEPPYGDVIGSFRYTDAEGRLVPTDQIPGALALRERRPRQAVLCVTYPDGVTRRMAITAIPLEGQGGVVLGVMTMFWEEGAA